MNPIRFYKLFNKFRGFIPILKNLKFDGNSFYKNAAHSSIFWGGYFLVKPKSEEQSRCQIEQNLLKLKYSCEASENEIKGLISHLENAIVDTGRKYRSCLQEQMSIMEKGASNESVYEYWNSLANLRDEAGILKRNYESLRCMLLYVGQLTFNAAFCSAAMSNSNTRSNVTSGYFKLEKIAKEETAKHLLLEEALLKRNMKSMTANYKETKKKRVMEYVWDSADFLVERLGLCY